MAVMDPVHRQDDDDDMEPRVRAPLAFWDRIKFILIFVVVFIALVAVQTTNNPIEPISAAARSVASNEWWLMLLLGIELLRQAGIGLAERNEAWNIYFSEVVSARFSGIGSGWNDWTRFRVSRALKIFLVLALISVVAAAHYHVSPLVGIFEIPASIASSLPTIVQFALIMVIAVGQFVLIFWYMSRGGVDVYFPGDVKTRFTDVWGQDSVLEKVKENIIYLKDPELIEERGGYVPGGILLWGPPGTGKTLMAEAVAGETSNPYVFVDPGAFTAMFFGVGILKVKRLFKQLRKLSLRYGGVVVFLDEADSLGRRGNISGGGQPTRSTPGPWSHGFDSCHGASYLSDHANSALTKDIYFNGGSVEDQPARRGISRFVNPVAGAGGGGMGGMDGTLQALLSELSGLKKPRGFFNRVVRRSLGLKPKLPPKYRILVMMATNMPESLDEALLRPGRIDRIYKVGYPSKEGRIRTYRGYLAKVDHSLTDDEIDRLATITPYATGAMIKDLVNEALINTIREGRESIQWKDVIKAKQLKELGPPEDVEYIERERHAVAVHEACHAVVAARIRKHMTIDLATIEKGGTYLGMVASIPPEDQFTSWRSEFEADIMVALASLAGERMFFEGDNSSGVSGDLEFATRIASMMEGYWGMGATLSSQMASQVLGFGAGGSSQKRKDGKEGPRGLGDRIEGKLEVLYRQVWKILEENRVQVLALAHALATAKTVTGEDVMAIMEFQNGPLLDGTIYGDREFQAKLEEYHRATVEAHRNHTNVEMALPLEGAFRKSQSLAIAELEGSTAVAYTEGGRHSRRTPMDDAQGQAHDPEGDRP